MREKLISLIFEGMKKYQPGNKQYLRESIADYLLANDVNILPCKVGKTVYKICPKCNDRHNGNCNHCAWRGCFMSGCDVGVRVYSDGSYNEKPLQVVPYSVTRGGFVTIVENWNVLYFPNSEEAEKAISEYDKIRKIEDRKERYKKYLSWEAQRKQHYSFLKGGDE